MKRERKTVAQWGLIVLSTILTNASIGKMVENPNEPTVPPENQLNDVVTPGIPQGYRQGIITAITVLLGFTLALYKYWMVEPGSGEWTTRGVILAVVFAAALVCEVIALVRALRLADNAEKEYEKTVAWFSRSAHNFGSGVNYRGYLGILSQ